MLEPPVPVDDRGGLPLRAGVELPDPLGAEPLDPRALQPRRARLGEVPHEAQRGQVVALRHLVGSRQMRFIIGTRYTTSTELLDRRERRLRRSAPGPRGARRRAAPRTTRPPDRCGRAAPASAGSRPGRRPAWAAPIHLRRIAGDDELGRPVEPPEVGAFQAGDVTSGSGVSSTDGWGAYGRQACPGTDPIDAHDDLRAGELDDLAQLGVREPVRHRLGDRSDLPGRRRRDVPGDRVRRAIVTMSPIPRPRPGGRAPAGSRPPRTPARGSTRRRT